MLAMILAGGGGTRLWPMSRSATPKQFLNLSSEDLSLLQATAKRLHPLIKTNDVHILGSKAHAGELLNQMQQLDGSYPAENLLLEPMARNTAPAILWGLLSIPEHRRDEAVVFLPADHLIQREDKFREYLSQAETLANAGYVVTFGIQPDRPETGYGYIKAGTPLTVGFKLDSFKEKPNLETAKQYLQEGGFTWNGGIFMAKPAVLIEEFKQHAPAIYNVFEEALKEHGNLSDEDVLLSVFQTVPADSIDYAVMERTQKAAVLPVQMDWSDLGSWESIHQIATKDENGNKFRGNVMGFGVKNSLIMGQKRLVAAIGVQNLIVVDTPDALLICDLHQTQDVKKVVEELKAQNSALMHAHTHSTTPWGSATSLTSARNYKVQLLEIKPGHGMWEDSVAPLQWHMHRDKHWIVVQGTAFILNSEEQVYLTESESVSLPKTVPHLLENQGVIPLVILEVQHGDYLGDDDVRWSPVSE